MHRERRVRKTYIIAVDPIEVVLLFECDVGIRDDAGVMEVVKTRDVRKQTTKDEDVASLCHDWDELFTALDFTTYVTSGQSWVQSLRMVVQILDNA